MTRRWWPCVGLVALASCWTPSPSRCAASCASDGLCAIRTERTGDSWYRCYAATDAQCAASARCATEGACFAAEDGGCVPQAEVASHRCAVSRECAVWGGCQPRDGFCEPRTDADCAGSLECRTQGRCTADDGSCQVVTDQDCASATACPLDGLCTVQGGWPFGRQCGVAPDGDCTRSLDCTRFGRCTPRPAEGCSEGCRLYYCGRDGEPAPIPCALRSGDPACLPGGRCILDERGRCMAVP